MIKKLRIKFIVLTSVSLFALLTIIVAGMNILNYNSVVSEADRVLSLLSQNNGSFPDFGGHRGDRLPPNMSPEIPYESRFFSVVINISGDIIRTETNQIISVDRENAIEYARLSLQKRNNIGFVGDFRFVRSIEGDAIRITFLDCGRRLNAYRNFLMISIIMAFAGFIIVLLVIAFFSGKFIRPIAESYEKQKRFITDAGHEIKTPLTIINANVDILEMDIGENECLDDIAQQAKRLTALTNDLVYLARMEEAENSLQMIEFPVSEVVYETAIPFKALAAASGKQFSCSVQPMLSVRGNNKAIEQMVSILMDNALKYSPEGGEVSLSFFRQNRNLILSVFNTTASPVKPEDLQYVFDRFYRLDSSRNSETGGHGIGLSVAKAIAAAHGGKIAAGTNDGLSFEITVTLPI
ncbi:MAG: HAMP domain-containing histidine kinase [Oscillospiraceae bacterium]|nr:HAMP domain-containing histidine kinase [Oscillospiraceae bacterium]